MLHHVFPFLYVNGLPGKEGFGVDVNRKKEVRPGRIHRDDHEPPMDCFQGSAKGSLHGAWLVVHADGLDGERFGVEQSGGGGVLKRAGCSHVWDGVEDMYGSRGTRLLYTPDVALELMYLGWLVIGDKDEGG